MKRAFTLLEILVVIGIIALLLSMLMSSYSTAQKKARDAKRSGDLHAAQGIMEQCYALNSFAYPTNLANNNGVVSANCPAGTGSTLAFNITDPLNNAPYQYAIANGSSTSYQISVLLEAGNGASASVSNQQ